MMQQLHRQILDLGGHGGGEQQRLMLLRELRGNLAYIVTEAHVQHTIRLVQHEGLHVIQTNVSLPHQVKQAARTGHYNIRPSVQRVHLCRLIHAAEQHAGEYRQLLAVGHKVVLNLLGQLPGGGKDQRTNGPRLARTHGPLCQALQNRQRKGRRLARARLRTAQHVLARKHQRDRRLLNGGGGRITALLHSAKQLRH